jgi:hypothetical protein
MKRDENLRWTCGVARMDKVKNECKWKPTSNTNYGKKL